MTSQRKTGVYFDSIRNLLLSKRLVPKCKNPSRQGVCHCADARWVTPSRTQFKPAKSKDSQFRLDKKDILNIEPYKFSFFKEGNHLNMYFFKFLTHVWLLCDHYFCPFLSGSQKYRGRQRKLSLTGMQCSSIFCF